MSTATRTVVGSPPATRPDAPAANRIREPTATYLRRFNRAIAEARAIPARRHPMRRVVSSALPDPRRPIYRDYLLECGHRYPHVPLRRGADRRFHVATCMRCPLCAVGAPPRGSNPTGAAHQLPAPGAAPVTQPDQAAQARPETQG